MTYASHTTAACSCSVCSGTTNSFRLAAVFLLFAASSVGAQESPGIFELTPYGGYRFGGTLEDVTTGDETELDDDAGIGLILNLRESSNTQWELIYARQETSADLSTLTPPQSSVDVRLQSLQLGGTYLGEGNRARPYVAATIGGTHIEPDSLFDGDTFWSFSIGGGLQVAPANRFGLRLEARVWGTLIDTDSSLFCTSDAQGGLCAIETDSRVLWQFETFAGVVFRF